MKNTLLTRYWFIIYPEDRFGAGNIGVTAYSKEHAISFIGEAMTSFNWQGPLKPINDNTEVIENIDINLLDQNHVLVNMGIVVHEGVWWPNLNR